MRQTAHASTRSRSCPRRRRRLGDLGEPQRPARLVEEHRAHAHVNSVSTPASTNAPAHTASRLIHALLSTLDPDVVVDQQRHHRHHREHRRHVQRDAERAARDRQPVRPAPRRSRGRAAAARSPRRRRSAPARPSARRRGRSTSGTTTTFSSRRLTFRLTQRKCARGLTKRKSPNAISATPAPRCSADGSVTTPSPSTTTATSRIDASWPIAIAGSARNDRPAVALLHPERDREQPAHGGVQPVVGAEQPEQDPGPERRPSLSPGSSTSRSTRRRPPGAPGAGARR